MKYGYKNEIFERYVSMLGEKEAIQLVKANEKPLKKSIRVNTLRISPKELCERLKRKGFSLEKTRYCNYGYYVKEGKFSIGSTTEYLMGYYYIQEAVSMIPSLELEPKENEIVLDMCAAPGGKTTHLSQIMKNKGVIVACEIVGSRMKTLRSNIQRMGVKNVVGLRIDVKRILNFNLRFDKILLDAPCSGEGIVRKESKRKGTLCLRDIKICSERQKKLIDVAISVLKRNGMLVYCTCTFAPEENEFIVKYASERGMKLVKMRSKFGSPGLTSVFGKELGKEMKLTRRFWPHIHDTQGFFIAKMVKK